MRSFPLSQIPGQTALNGARRLGKSVVCGHTHRLGSAAFTEASRGQLGRTVWGHEVGNLVDLSSSGMAYTRGYANWQQGFAVAYVHERKVQVITVPINSDGSESIHEITPVVEYAFEQHTKKGFYVAFQVDQKQSDIYWLAWECLRRADAPDVFPFGEKFLIKT